MNHLPSEDCITALIASVRCGDETAFAELLDRYLPLLQSLASAFDSSRVGFDELLQEARFALYRAAISYREGGVTFGLYAKISARITCGDLFTIYDLQAVPRHPHQLAKFLQAR